MAEIDDSIISGADVRKISDVNDATIDHAHSAVFNRRAIHRDDDARAYDHFSAVAAVYDRRKRSQRLDKDLLYRKIIAKEHRPVACAPSGHVAGFRCPLALRALRRSRSAPPLGAQATKACVPLRRALVGRGSVKPALLALLKFVILSFRAQS